MLRGTTPLPTGQYFPPWVTGTCCRDCGGGAAQRRCPSRAGTMPQRCLEEIDSEIKEVHGRTFRKLGSLLIEIVDRKLFQLKGFTNVEDYFNSEPHLPSARQAFRLISATRFSRHLPHTLPQPKSERQVSRGPSLARLDQPDSLPV